MRTKFLVVMVFCEKGDWGEVIKKRKSLKLRGVGAVFGFYKGLLVVLWWGVPDMK